jgi:predicted SAM-dependent methyltransferase
MTDKKITKINLGAGPDGIVGWQNFDWGMLPFLAKFGLLDALVSFGFLAKEYKRVWPKFSLVDIRKKIPVNDKSVDFVYCSHVLEHFEKNETLRVLNEAKRVLKKGGTARFVLPDLDKIIKIKEADKMCRVWWGYDKDKLTGWKKYFIRGHQWLYSKKSFGQLLKEVGFSKIKFLEYKQGRVSDLDKLDLPIHQDLSFYVEVEK